MQHERTIGEVAAKVTTYSGAGIAFTFQQWSGVIIGTVGLLITWWLGHRRDAREKERRKEEHEEHLARLEEIRRNPDRRTTGIYG